MRQNQNRAVLFQPTRRYLSKDLLFLAECMLISPHIAAVCQTVQTQHPPHPPFSWTPSKMASDWWTEYCSHGNQLFGKFSAGRGRRDGPVGAYPADARWHRQADGGASLWCLCPAGDWIKKLKKMISDMVAFIQPPTLYPLQLFIWQSLCKHPHSPPSSLPF